MVVGEEVVVGFSRKSTHAHISNTSNRGGDHNNNHHNNTRAHFLPERCWPLALCLFGSIRAVDAIRLWRSRPGPPRNNNTTNKGTKPLHTYTILVCAGPHRDSKTSYTTPGGILAPGVLLSKVCLCGVSQ